MNKLGNEIYENIEWTSPRLICIANDFTKYDIHAVKQINRNIDLIKYKNYKEELLLLEMVHPKSDTVLIYTKANIDEIELKNGFTRDVTNIGHYGTGNLEIRFTDIKQFEEVQRYILSSYEAN